MAKFLIKWTTGKSEVVEQSDCRTVEQFINCRFGSSPVLAEVSEYLEPVEPVEPVEHVEPVEPVAKPRTKK